jgi:UDP-N-acetylglucosamine--N-acetylmuramyl-(pentapeptide) pyrophosphoryl-undecaprenol N-acetylglucosamine transferase
MTTSGQRTALIMAGGTGGHIFPGLAVAEVMKARGWNVVWMGNPQALEGRLVSEHGIKLEAVVFSGLRGKGMAALFLLPIRLSKALLQAACAIKKIKPSVVLGMGGYVAFPGGMMARFLCKPLVVHEQNSIAGMANRYLAKMAVKVLEAFPNTLSKALWVGNPVRASLSQVSLPTQRFAQRTGPLKLLVVGGSLGASALNNVIPNALALLPENKRPVVLHQAGQAHIDSLKVNYQQAGVSAECVGFIADMAAALADADVVVCRAGAMTVAEVAAVGAAALFVPFPFAVDDHQTTNAMFLVNKQAAWIKQQNELTAEWLAQWFESLNRDVLLAYANAARALAKPEAASAVADILEQVATA